jgi:hypothetical protein
VRALLAVLVVLPSTTTVAAVAKRVPKAEQGCEVLEHGRYHATTPRVTIADASSPTGDRFETDEVEFTDRTKTIARALDTTFGFRYRLTLRPDLETRITWRITYPRPLNGKRSWVFTERWSTPNGELVQHIGYTFTDKFELVPGEWKMQVLVEDQPACAVTFTVK